MKYTATERTVDWYYEIYIILFQMW